MGRPRVVHRTVREHIYTVLVADIENQTTVQVEWREGGDKRKDRTILNAVGRHLGEGFKPIKVLACTYESHVYEMPESEFLANARRVM